MTAGGKAAHWQGAGLLAFAVPLATVAFAAVGPLFHVGEYPASAVVATALVLGSAFSGVFHAESISARIGQPFGTLVLTLSVTFIEVSVLLSMMLNGANNPTLARESVLSTVMFVCTGIVGACLLLGSLRHNEQEVRQQGVNGYLSVIISLSVICLVLPSQTTAGLQGQNNTVQVAFIMGGTVLLYGAFLVMQTGRHRGHFLEDQIEDKHAGHTLSLWLAVPGLILSLCGVVVLSGLVAVGVETFLDQFNLPDPDAVVGAAVVSFLLMPEAITAIRAARRNQLQRALNTALGSALATIGLTMPAMAVVGWLVGRPITLGLDPEDRVQLLLALLLSVVSFGTGRTNLLTGMVHMVLFLIYVMTLFVP